MGSLSWWHWLLIIAAFILLFGAKKLPDAARGLGRSLRILKSEVAAMHEDGGKPAQPAETNASAAVATPASQLAPSAPPVAAPAPETPPQVVINGEPVSEKQQ